MDRTASARLGAQDIYNEKISESLTVQQCREKLENKYRDQLCKIQMKPWDHTDYVEFKDMHTVVTMVKKDAHGKDTKRSEILQGSVAKIFSTKVNGKLPARILISAPAGRGKTTAVAKMAYDWVHRERGSALEHLPLLFVVKFRNTGQLTSIGEAIKSQLLSDVHDLTPEGLESFIRKNQGICHIILDGLDEYAGISPSQRCSWSNIVSVIRSEEFPECRVIVTTRPHLEIFFNPVVYTKMSIEGFSLESSREYICKYFASISNPYKGHSLKDYLDEQPLFDELVKTPLFCRMICHLWDEGLLDSGTTTQTELLDSVNICLMHHANARSKSRVKITRKKLRKIICQLGKVALTGLLDDAKKLVFTPHDFRKVPAILEKACKLGIVSKTTVSLTRLPQSTKTTTIEFYHKLAQEHSAGKFLADQTYHFLLRLKISKLDKVLLKIKAKINDYENVIRFAAGTDNKLCIRIMEALLSNRFLDESERYRILLDCSSETKGTEGNVSSLVQRCVNEQGIVLKSPTVYTVVGMQNLPKQLKREVRTVMLEGSTVTTDVTSGLWSCLKGFLRLNTLIISDSSLSFPSSPLELPSITWLSAESVTSQSYEGLLTSLPGLEEIDITIDDAERDIPQITAGLRRTVGQQLTRIKLTAPDSLPSKKNRISRETMRGLGLLIREQTKKLQMLDLSELKCTDEKDLVYLIECCKRVETISYVWLDRCGTMEGGRLGSHLISSHGHHVLCVNVLHDDIQDYWYSTYTISRSCAREQSDQSPSFTRREHGKILKEFSGKAKEVLTITTETLQGNTDSTSPRPSASTSVTIPFQDASAAPCDPFPAGARALCIDEQPEDEDGSSATGNFGALGGNLSTKSHGLSLHIPPGALEEDEKISLRVLTEIPNGLTLKDDEILVSHGFQCYPSGLCFKKPAKLIIPHCALVTAPNKVQTVLYSWNQSGTPERLPHSSDIICSVQERWLEVSISHFSGGFFAFIWDWLFLKGILLSCMSFLPRVLTSRRNPILEVRFVKMPHDQKWKAVHELTNDGPQPVKNEDDYVVFRRRTLKVSCQLSEKDPKTYVIQHSDMDLIPRETKYFKLDLTDESDETLVTLNLTQATTKTIKFKTRFQGIEEMCKEQDTPTTSRVETPADRSREQDFDDFLRTVAKQIPIDVDIDSLGKELGFEPAEITRYIQTNERYQTVTYMGTLSMLRDWRNKSTRSKEHQELKKALIAINHHRLADDLQNNDPAS